ncbi:MAG: tetratricopeptide repeat protein [Planctomycetes bacterium]|nr:tetratricopeptide repeat protein [Planctomycetota bacterium]
MSIRFVCACGKELSAPEAAAGGRRKCPECGEIVVVAAAAVSETEAAVPETTVGSVWQLLGQDPGARPSLALTVLGDDEVRPAAEPSEWLGRYPVLGTIGKGGMGKVLLVRDPELGRELAAKVALGGASVDRRHLEKFLLEAQVTGQLEHPNIIPLHELGLADGKRAYFTMKRVKGKDLEAVLSAVAASEGKLSSSTSGRRRAAGRSSGVRKATGEAPEGAYSLVRLLEVFLKVCDAVAFAHSRGVIHRDLKPANIMVGEFGEVLVMDWGIAKVIGQPEVVDVHVHDGAPLQTADGSVVGTPSYMPPEQARGEIEKLDQRSDIYSLGAILYQVLTLAPPFTGKSTWAIVEKVLAGKLVPPSRRAPGRDVPRELEAAVTKAMAPSQEERYDSVGALRADIEAYLAGRTLSAAEYSPWQVLAKWARRNKVAVAGGAATAVALLVGLFGIVFVLGRAEAEKLREAERARLEEKAETDRARASEAEALYAKGRVSWDEAEGAPFNRAAPQDYFRPHVAALLALGRALETHPHPPADWAPFVARAALEAQEKAELAGDWAFAQVLAESAGTWGAVDPDEAAHRLARVDQARGQAAEDDEATLREILERIARAEGAADKGGALVPGEIPERASRLALHGPPELTSHVIALLAGEKKKKEGKTAAEREFLVEFLGRKGDIHADHEGVTAPMLVQSALESAREPGKIPASEVVQWLWAAARLEAREAGTFEDLTVRANSLQAAYEGLALVTNAARDALAYLAAIRDKAPLPSISGDAKANVANFERRLEELADWAAGQVRSGGDHARLLLDLAEEKALSARQLAFVYGQIGLLAFKDPPDPARPERTAAKLLRSAFDASFPVILAAAKERSAPPGEAVTVAAAAADGLSRLEDEGFTLVLSDARIDAGEYSLFGARTAVALALLPATSNEPRTAADYNHRGIAREAQGDLAGATEDYTRALKLDPNNALAYNNRGLARAAQGDLAGATEDYTRALELDTNYATAYSNRGIAREAQGDLDGATEDFTRAILLDPNYAGAYNNRGVARADQGDLAGAIEDYTRGIELDPNFPLAYNNRGNARQAQGDLAGATEDLTRAIQLDPNFALAYSNRGSARQAQGDLAGAINDYDRALEIDQDFWQSWTARGMTLARLGRIEEARASFERALAVCPPGARAQVEGWRRQSLGE